MAAKNRKCDRRFAGTVCTCKHVIASHAAGALGTDAGGHCLHRYCECRRYRPACVVCKAESTRLPAVGDVLEPVSPALCAACRAAFRKTV